jgi:hypothetical protein
MRGGSGRMEGSSVCFVSVSSALRRARVVGFLQCENAPREKRKKMFMSSSSSAVYICINTKKPMEGLCLGRFYM